VRELTLASLQDPEGPLLGAARIAEGFLQTWLPAEQMPEGPSLA
jgi:hypothetical protein